jgi:hypothetical protein
MKRVVEAALAGLMLAGVACGTEEPPPPAAASHVEGSGSTADTAPSQPSGAGAMTADEAEARARQQTARFPTVDRIESKLMTWRELHEAQGSGDQVFTIDDDTQIWVVAVSGTFRPGHAPAGVAPLEFRWGVVVYEEASGMPLASFGGPDGDWPPYFDRLPDRRS